MTKIFVAVVLIAAAAPLTAASAANSPGRAAFSQGRAIDICRDQINPAWVNHQSRLAIAACVERMRNGAHDSY